jgi:outer membrane receptor for ferrienterochelin and colicins
MQGVMSKSCLVLLATLLLLNCAVQAQRQISGRVFFKNDSGRNEPAAGAVIATQTTGNGTTTSADGTFTISIVNADFFFTVSYVGFLTDTERCTPGKTFFEIQLASPHELAEHLVTDKIRSNEVSLLNPMKVERLNQQELYKAACCNLSQSFETTPSVDVSFTDAVTGYRQIRMLGLSSPYTLITQENIPMIRGLASIAGLSLTPGAWMEGIQLSKGTGSVVNGFESLAGQINIELKKNFSGEKLFANVYQGSQGNSEASLNYRHNFNDRLGMVVLTDFTSQWMKTDLNGDHFVDQPLGNHVNLLSRWIYNGNNGWVLQAGIHPVYGHFVGGDWGYKEGMLQTDGNSWGYVATTARFEDWAKIAKVFSQRDETSIGLQLANVSHDQESQYGQRTYSGIQNSFYGNLIFQTYIGNKDHQVKAGISESLDNYNEKIDFKPTGPQYYMRSENVAGIFAEYAYNYGSILNIVAGLRGDQNNYFGAFATPRLHIRYAPIKNVAIRASVGRAQRTANIFADNIGFMASNRQIDIVNPQPNKPYGLNPEVAWNTGLNFTWKFKYRYHQGMISADYYYTWFQNQVIADVNYPNILTFYNLIGRSYAHSFQVQADVELIRRLNVRVAYRLFDVMTTYGFTQQDATLQEKPFVPAHRAFTNWDYETLNHWKFDYTMQWLSEQRTPFAIHSHGTGSGINAYSPPFFQMNAQVTKIVNERAEFYLGGENLTNYMQHDAIVNYSKPFQAGFDASMIWGPMMGINVYLGVRYKFI